MPEITITSYFLEQQLHIISYYSKDLSSNEKDEANMTLSFFLKDLMKNVDSSNVTIVSDNATITKQQNTPAIVTARKTSSQEQATPPCRWGHPTDQSPSTMTMPPRAPSRWTSIQRQNSDSALVMPMRTSCCDTSSIKATQERLMVCRGKSESSLPQPKPKNKCQTASTYCATGTRMAICCRLRQKQKQQTSPVLPTRAGRTTPCSAADAIGSIQCQILPHVSQIRLLTGGENHHNLDLLGQGALYSSNRLCELLMEYKTSFKY